MKTPISTRVLALAAISCSAFAAAPAALAQGTFTPGTPTTNTNCNPSSSPTASFSCTAGSVTVTMTAWGYMGATDGWKPGMIGDFDDSGIGAYTGNKETSGTGQHAFDNLTSGCGGATATGTGGLSSLNNGCGGSVEALLLDFGSSSVSMSKIGVGYVANGGDGDMSVYAWTGPASAPTMPTQTVSTTIQNANNPGGTLAGWTLVGSKDFASAGTWTFANSSAYSSYFLITTYFGATSGGLGNDNNDGFKLNTFTVACNVNCVPVTRSNVPEPASLALASLGLVGVIGMRRRGTRKSS